MRRTGQWFPRHRSILSLLAVVAVLVALATPTWQQARPEHTDRVAVLAQQPLPHCAAIVPAALPPENPGLPGLSPALGAPAAVVCLVRGGVVTPVSARDPPLP